MSELSWVSEKLIQYKLLRKKPRPKNHPIKKKNLLLCASFFAKESKTNKQVKVIKLINVKLYGCKLNDVQDPKTNVIQ